MHSVAHSLVGKTYMTAPIILKLLKPGPAGQRTEQQKIRSMNSTKQQEKILSGPYHTKQATSSLSFKKPAAAPTARSQKVGWLFSGPATDCIGGGAGLVQDHRWHLSFLDAQTDSMNSMKMAVKVCTQFSNNN